MTTPPWPRQEARPKHADGKARSSMKRAASWPARPHLPASCPGRNRPSGPGTWPSCRPARGPSTMSSTSWWKRSGRRDVERDPRRPHARRGLAAIPSLAPGRPHRGDLQEPRHALSLNTALRYLTTATMASQRAQRAFLQHRKAKQAGLLLPERPLALPANENRTNDMPAHPSPHRRTRQFLGRRSRPAAECRANSRRGCRHAHAAARRRSGSRQLSALDPDLHRARARLRLGSG